MIVVVTGVAGAGKSTIGSRLADRLDWPYLEADEFHPPASRRKMERGVPLSEADRGPWLDSMAAAIRAVGENAVVSCSCLRRSHRERMRAARPDTRFVHLRIDAATARDRVAERPDHFFGASLVESQFEALEEPADGRVIDGTRPPEELVDDLLDWLASTGAVDRAG